MAVLPILITGDPVLHSVAAPVTDFGEQLALLVDDMVETMAAAPGVGLAAPQVGVPLRLFVWNWTDEHDQLQRGVAINPELWISPARTGEADEEEESEGCLSIPGERFPLRRSELAILETTDLSGQHRERIRASGWLARIFQHEFDHLNGVLYSDRLDRSQAKGVAAAIKRNSWGVPGKQWMPGVDHPEG
ncbi:peptide deformylase [soil metagenome]